MREKTTYTTEDARQYIDDHTQEIILSLEESKDVPTALKCEQFIVQLWAAGCWLNHTLEQAGASKEENQAICFAHGQRCFGRDPLEQAVRLANEFIATGTTKDQPGPKLAEEICRDVLKLE